MSANSASVVQNTDLQRNPIVINFENIVNEYGPFLRQFIYRKLWDKQNVDDVFQTVLMEAFKSRHAYKANSPPKYWLMGIANNVINNSIRKTSVKTSCYGDYEHHCNALQQDSPHTEDPAITLERDALISCLEKALQALPESIQVTVNEVINRGQSYAQTAEKLSIPIGTVRSRLAKARSVFRQQLENWQQ